MSSLPPALGVVAVIQHNDRLLVIRRAEGVIAPGCWCFPGGGVEPGESMPDALVREVREEIGIDVEAVEPLWEWTRPDGLLVLSWWRARLLDSSAILNPNPAEVAETRWATPDEVRRLHPLLPSNLDFLNRFCPRNDE